MQLRKKTPKGSTLSFRRQRRTLSEIRSPSPSLSLSQSLVAPVIYVYNCELLVFVDYAMTWLWVSFSWFFLCVFQYLFSDQMRFCSISCFLIKSDEILFSVFCFLVKSVVFWSFGSFVRSQNEIFYFFGKLYFLIKLCLEASTARGLIFDFLISFISTNEKSKLSNKIWSIFVLRNATAQMIHIHYAYKCLNIVKL